MDSASPASMIPPSPEPPPSIPVSGDVAKSPKRRWLLGGAGVALVASVLGLVLHVTRKSAAEPAIAPDIPRADGTAILFSKGFRDRAGIRYVPVRRSPITPVLKAVGAVTFDPEHVAAVGTRIRGFVRKLNRIEGDAVKAGEVLAEVESAELGEAQASVAMIHAQKKAAELNATRERDLVGRRLSTAREAEVAQANLDEYRAMLGAAEQKVTALGGSSSAPFGVRLLRAPLAGTVVERHVFAGQSVEGNLVAYRVADLDHLWVELAAFERNLPSIHKGDTVEVCPMGDVTRMIAGQVAYVGDEIDETTRSAPVRIKVDNRTRALRPGQSVTAAIHMSGPARDTLLVPATAITLVDGKPTIFVLEGEDRVLPTPVELGSSNGVEQEITAGLLEGTTVVSEGVFAIKSELFR